MVDGEFDNLTVNNVLTIGADTNLYRSATNTLSLGNADTLQLFSGNGVIRLGHGIRSSNRAELHLHANGESNVSEIMFGYNERNDANVRWAISDRGSGDSSLLFYAGPYWTGAGFSTIMQLRPDGQVRLPVTGSSGGLLIGGDANLYRSATNVLKTDDTFKAIEVQIERASSEGPALVLVNPNKTGLGNHWSIYNMTDGYGDSLQFWVYGGEGWGHRLVLTDAGQLKLPISGSTAGLVLGGDAHLYRSAANKLELGSNDDLILGNNQSIYFRDTDAGLGLRLHSASNTYSYIDLSSGNRLYIRSNEGSHNYAMLEDGVLNLYDSVGNASLIAIYNEGIRISTGDCAYFMDNGELTLGNSALTQPINLRGSLIIINSANGLQFGDDVTLYRGDTNQLKTDDYLNIDGNFNGYSLFLPNGGIYLGNDIAITRASADLLRIDGDLTINKAAPTLKLNATSGDALIQFYDAGTLKMNLAYSAAGDYLYLRRMTGEPKDIFQVTSDDVIKVQQDFVDITVGSTGAGKVNIWDFLESDDFNDPDVGAKIKLNDAPAGDTNYTSIYGALFHEPFIAPAVVCSHHLIVRKDFVLRGMVNSYEGVLLLHGGYAGWVTKPISEGGYGTNNPVVILRESAAPNYKNGLEIRTFEHGYGALICGVIEVRGDSVQQFVPEISLYYDGSLNVRLLNDHDCVLTFDTRSSSTGAFIPSWSDAYSCGTTDNHWNYVCANYLLYDISIDPFDAYDDLALVKLWGEKDKTLPSNYDSSKIKPPTDDPFSILKGTDENGNPSKLWDTARVNSFALGCAKALAKKQDEHDAILLKLLNEIESLHAEITSLKKGKGCD